MRTSPSLRLAVFKPPVVIFFFCCCCCEYIYIGERSDKFWRVHAQCQLCNSTTSHTTAEHFSLSATKVVRERRSRAKILLFAWLKLCRRSIENTIKKRAKRKTRIPAQSTPDIPTKNYGQKNSERQRWRRLKGRSSTTTSQPGGASRKWTGGGSRCPPGPCRPRRHPRVGEDTDVL